MSRVDFAPPVVAGSGLTRGLTYPGHSPFALDINRGWGSTDLGDRVQSSLAGTVVKLEPAYGGVELQHLYGYVTRYFHLAGIVVRLGQHVSAGQILGTVSNTYPKPRVLSPHLHYEQHRFGKPIRVSFHGTYYPASLEGVDHLVYGPPIV